MKKIILTAVGFSFTLSILSSNHFIAAALNKGDGGAPQRPDLAYTHGETWSPAYNIGDGGIISNKSVEDPGGGAGMVSNEAEGDTPAPANNKGDGGGIISNKSVKDPGGGMVSNESVEDPGGGGCVINNKSVSDPGTGSPSYAVHGDPGGHIVSNEADGDTGGSPSYGHADTPAPQA